MALAPMRRSRSRGERADVAVAGETLRSGIRHAGPVAAAGWWPTGPNVLVTVFLSRLLHTHQYGSLAQLLGLFVILSMPGSAVLVGVVRRVTSWEASGQADRVQAWAGRLHAWGTLAVLAFAALTWVLQGWVAHELSLPSPAGVLPVFTAGGVDPALGRPRPSPGAPLLQVACRETSSWSRRAIGLHRGAGRRQFGVGGACLGLLLCEVVAAVQAVDGDVEATPRPWGVPLREVLRWRAHHDSTPAGRTGLRTETMPPGLRTETMPPGLRTETEGHGRRDLLVDVGVAMLSLALLGVLQNADVILLGREAPRSSGSTRRSRSPARRWFSVRWPSPGISCPRRRSDGTRVNMRSVNWASRWCCWPFPPWCCSLVAGGATGIPPSRVLTPARYSAPAFAPLVGR